jgi:uncharacterized protein DUF6152
MLQLRCLAVAVAVFGSVGSVLAHHSYAAYDLVKSVTVQGTVRTLEWTNPHVWVWVDVADDQGRKEAYGFEGGAPSELVRFFGWTKHALAPGEAVTVDYAPLKNGLHGGALRTLRFPDGRVLQVRRPTPADPASPLVK